MKGVQGYFNQELITWFKANNLMYEPATYKLDKGTLSLLFNANYCLKIYDCVGHGFGVTINLAENRDESVYENDKFSLTWAYKFFKIEEAASFSSRSKNQYLKNLPNLIDDIKAIVPLLNRMNSKEWDGMTQWIDKEANRLYGHRE